MAEKVKFTVITTKGFRFESPKKQPEKIKITSSVYDVFKDFELKDTFYLDEELKYTMSGKTLKYILEQMPKDAKIPFADIEQEKGYTHTFEVDLSSKQAQNYRCEQMEKVLKAPSKVYIYKDGKYIEL